MLVCADVTELVKVDFISGIQRVVIEILTRWISNGQPELRLLSYSFEQGAYLVLEPQRFYQYYAGEIKKKSFFTEERMQIEDFNQNMIFFDLDSVWMNFMKRSYLLPLLKKQGTRIVALIYDIIPVTDTQYCHEFTTLNFMEYLGAHLKYGDKIISNANATLESIRNLISGTEVIEINGSVVPLGSDFKKKVGEKTKLREQIRQIAEKGRFVLMVGTIEPRKNHRFVLEAFEESLFAEGINLVFAGRRGWNVEAFFDYIQHHPQKGKQFFYLSDATDDEIDYLYKESFLVAFASHNEGFGLPIIEAFDRGTPVLAADIPVLREVGADYCQYFGLEDTSQFAKLVLELISNEDSYRSMRKKINTYKKTSWDETAQRMVEELQAFEEKDN